MRLITKRFIDLIEDCSLPPSISYDFSYRLNVQLLERINDYLINHSPRRLRHGWVLYITSKILLDNNQWTYGRHKREVNH